MSGIDSKQAIVVEHHQGIELIAFCGLRVVGKDNTLCERYVVVAHHLKIAVAEFVGTFERGCIFVVFSPLKEHEVSVLDAVLVGQTIVERGAAAAEAAANGSDEAKRNLTLITAAN